MDKIYVFLVVWILEDKYESKIFQYEKDAFKYINNHKDINFSIFKIEERWDVSKIFKGGLE